MNYEKFVKELIEKYVDNKYRANFITNEILAKSRKSFRDRLVVGVIAGVLITVFSLLYFG